MPEVDEFGIPIRKLSNPVDEFGIPIKKKDGGTPSMELPSQSTSLSVSEDPILDLVKKRSQLKFQLEPKKSSAPGFVPTFTDNTALQSDLKKVDDQIRSFGLDPDEVEKDFGGFEATKFDNEFIKNLYTQKKDSPLQYKRLLAASNWHDASRAVINRQTDPMKKDDLNAKLNTAIDAGSKINKYNDALAYGKNTLALIYESTAGDRAQRQRAIENFKQDFIPVLTRTFLKDADAMNAMKGKNIQKEFGLVVDEIFNPQIAGQTRQGGLRPVRCCPATISRCL